MRVCFLINPIMWCPRTVGLLRGLTSNCTRFSPTSQTKQAQEIIKWWVLHKTDEGRKAEERRDISIGLLNNDGLVYNQSFRNACNTHLAWPAASLTLQQCLVNKYVLFRCVTSAVLNFHCSLVLRYILTSQ